jgi:hypothetical protein
MRVASRLLLPVVAGCLVLGVSVPAQSPPVQQPPVPRPFPGATPPAPRQVEPPPGESTLGGAPVYPTAEFLESFDAGQGQRYYLYGSNTGYETIVTYYRSVLRNGGREIFKTPAVHQWELGRFDSNRMAFPPSVVVKDYSWNNSPGYLFVEGTNEKRFVTIIQIVPLTSDKLPLPTR